MTKGRRAAAGWLRWLSGRDRRPRAAPAEIAAAKAQVEAAFGPWTAHNCRLTDDLWTIRPESVNFDEKTRRCLRIAQGFFGPDLSGLRVLDLGAGEGGLSLELAAQGADVVCVEGRRANIAKAELAAAALGLEIDFRCQDVRLVGEDERFDLVLCFGLLYHLDATSAVRLVERIGRVAERIVVLDTHFSLEGAEEIELDGRRYRGHAVREHPADATPEARAVHLWASLDNDVSFWFSRPSLLNLLGRAGFDTVYETAWPLVFDHWDRQSEMRFKHRDRLTLVGAKSGSGPLLTAAAVNTVEPRQVPEDIDAQLVTWRPPASR